MIDQVQKVTPDHLRRDAYVYIRQATIHDGASKQRQPPTSIRVAPKGCCIGMAERTGACNRLRPRPIRSDSHDREGFQKLVADVSEGRVGIVLTLDVSRLSRVCRDWHHLLEACA